MIDQDPVTLAMVSGSTSAKLRETQAVLAASQADLTAMERERDIFRAVAQGNKSHVASLTEANETLERSRDQLAAMWRSLLDALGIDPATVETPVMQAKRIGRLAAEVPALKAQLAEATRYGWQVEQRGDTACARGGHAIPVGHAVQPMPGAKGFFQCVICPKEPA